MKRFILNVISFIMFLTAFFLLAYAFVRGKVQTNNSAIMLSVFCALSATFAAMLIKGIITDRQKSKQLAKNAENALLSALMLVTPQELSNRLTALLSKSGKVDRYKQLYITNDCSYAIVRKSAALGPDDVIPICRAMRQRGVTAVKLVTLTPLKQQAENVFSRCGYTVQTASRDELLQLCNGLTPMPNAPQKKAAMLLKEFALSRRSAFACVKYAVLLAVLSVFTRYRLIYLAVSLLLIGAAVFISVYKRRYYKTIV